MNSFYQIKEGLMELAEKLFKTEDLELKGTIDLKGAFDFITEETHGIRGDSPQEKMKYIVQEKEEDGIEFLRPFLSIAVQSGAAFQLENDKKEINRLERNDKRQSDLLLGYQASVEQYIAKINELELCARPKSELEQKIIDLEKEVEDLKSENRKLDQFKNLITYEVNRVNK